MTREDTLELWVTEPSTLSSAKLMEGVLPTIERDMKKRPYLKRYGSASTRCGSTFQRG